MADDSATSKTTTTSCALVEQCDGVDNDCDGELHPDELDEDGDGSPDCAICDDAGFWESLRDAGNVGDAITSLVDDQTCDDYGRAIDFMFLELDNDGGEVECVYTGRRTAVTKERPDGTDMNTEHSWPQSQGADAVPAKCDLHHLFPTDATVNNWRANLPFGEVLVDTQDIDGGSRLGEGAGGDLVFEPRDGHKGNVARAMTYFALQYGYTLTADDQALYAAWHLVDPVDDAEIRRSLAIAEHQVLANPLVVCDGLMDRL